MRSPFHQARLIVAVVLTLGPIGLVAAASTGVANAAPAASGVQVDTAPSGPFTSLPPARLLDTRSGTGAPTAPVAPGATLTLNVEGQGGVAPSGVSAVVLNVTVTQPKDPGFITVYPNGSPKPLSSNLNFTPGETIPNLVLAPVGPDGKIDLYNGSAGTVQLVADVSGYFTGGGSATNGALTSLTPSRLLDTRSGTGAPTAPVAPGATLTLNVEGQGGVAPSGVSAVVLNVTVTQPKDPGFITVYPNGSPKPLSSNLNFTPGETIPNLVLAPVGPDGKIDLYNGSAGTVQLVADVSGYFTGGGSATNGALTSLTPSRLLDTRSGTGAPTAPVAPGATLTLNVEGQGGVAPSGVSAVVLNVTVTQPKDPGFITVYPNGSPKPLSSNLNFTPGETIPNLVLAPVGPDGKIDLYNGSAGTVQLVADVSGYFNTILSGVRTLVTNSNDACALLFSGGVDCWGYNVNGQTGSGAATEYSLMPLPVRGLGGIGTLGGVASIATDGGGFCALLTSGGLDCWGSNGDGDLGNGTTTDGPVPVAVNGVGGTGTLSGVTSVVGGAFSYCALLNTGGVDCWGNNFYGGLGTASSASFSDVVGAVKGVGGTGALRGVASVVSDGTTVCAILASNGAVDCWGGQPIPVLGNGTDATSNVPVAVEGVGGTASLNGVASLSAQGETICAVLTSGGVDCWGEGSAGVLGAGPDVQGSTVPVAVESVGGTGALTGVAKVIGDGRSACALLTSGRVDCWGQDNEGQLGYGTIPLDGDSFVPGPVVGAGGTGTLSGVADLASNFSGFCASLAAGGVDCWGDNAGGQLGEGTVSGPDTCDGQSCSTSPAPVINPDVTGSLSGVADVVSNSSNEVGGYGYYAVLASGGVECWGAGTNAEGVLGNDPFQDSSAYSVPTPV